MARIRLLLALAIGQLAIDGCAAGNQGQTGSGGSGGDTTTSSGSTTTSSSSGGGGGTGGGTTSSSSGGGGATSTASSGGGGSGGVTTTSASSGGSGGGTTTSSSSSGGTGGSAPTETALVFAGSAATVLGGEYHPGGAWAVSSPGVGTPHRPATALLDEGNGVGLYRAPADGSLLFVKWAAGTFSAPLAIGNLAKAMDGPAMVRWNGGAAVAYHAPDFKHYLAVYQGPNMGWSPVAEPILSNNVHSFGPSAPALASVQGELVVVYAGDNGNLYDQKRVAGVWGGANGHGVDGTIDLTPAIVALPIGPSEAMVAYVRKTDAQVMFTLRSGGAWTAPAPVPDAFTNDPAALASASGNGAVLAFRGTNAMLYTTTYTPGANPSWSMPKSFGASTEAAPALATGIGGAEAEMVFVSGGAVKHARLTAGVWSAASPVGGVAITGVALATFSP